MRCEVPDLARQDHLAPRISTSAAFIQADTSDLRVSSLCGAGPSTVPERYSSVAMPIMRLRITVDLP